jgi:hypothetical protein
VILYLYLDESGSLKGDDDHYFVLLAVATTTPRVMRKCFVRARQTRLPEKYRHYTEIKFSDRVIPDQAKERILRELAELDIGLYALVVDKGGIPEVLRRQPEGVLYHHLVELLTNLCPIGECQALYVNLDRRHLPGLRREVFNAELSAYLFPRLRKGALLEIQHVDSTTDVNIQVADFLVGAVYHKYARGDERYYALIADRINVERVLFRE